VNSISFEDLCPFLSLYFHRNPRKIWRLTLSRLSLSLSLSQTN
jgi:hypothetical protein